MTKLIWTLFLLIQSIFATGQVSIGYNWQLGTKSSPENHTNPKSIEISFANGERNVNLLYRPLFMGSFNASISNIDGELLLYSNGCQINNGQHEIIDGSFDLNPGSVDEEWCDVPPSEYPIADGGLFLPFSNDSLIWLLHQRQAIVGPPLVIFVDALFYTSLQKIGTEYQIQNKSIPIIIDSLSEGRLEAIAGIAENYWWIIQGIRNSNKYYTIGIDAGQIDTVFVQSIGDVTVRQGEAASQSAFSPNGSKYARYSLADDLFLFDFDRQNGILSNYEKIHVADSGLIGGLAFSPNSRFLYVGSKFDLYQFDICSGNIQASKIHIGHYDGYVSPFPTTFYHMQLAPDNRIYMTPPNGVNILHVIESPNNQGKACNFKQHGLILPESNTISLPNFPVYPVLMTDICDSTTSSKDNVVDNPNLKTYPTSDIVLVDKFKFNFFKYFTGEIPPKALCG